MAYRSLDGLIEYRRNHDITWWDMAGESDWSVPDLMWMERKYVVDESEWTTYRNVMAEVIIKRARLIFSEFSGVE